MAVVTNNPRSRLSKIPGARTYSAVASRYADTFAKAVDQQEQNEISTNLSEFKLGNLSYDSFKKYLEDKIKGAPVGSKNRADWTGLLVDADKFNKSNLEKEAIDTIEKLRSEAIDKFKGAMTSRDELNLVTQLKSAVNKDTDAYEKLVTEEQNLKQKVLAEGKAASKKSIEGNLDKYFAIAMAENKKITEDYKAGRITGSEADKQLYQNGVNLNSAVKQAEKAGITVPAAVTTEIANGVVFLQDRLAKREVGQIFDVVNQKNGEVESVTHQDLLNDQSAGTQNYTKSKYVIEPNASGTIFNVVDSSTGKKVKTATNATQAKNIVSDLNKKEGGAFSVTVPQSDSTTGIISQKDFTFNPQTQTFATPDKPEEQVFAPNPNAGQRFLARAGAKLTDFISAGSQKLQQFLSPNEFGGTSVDVNRLQQQFLPPGVQGPTQSSPFILPEPTPAPTPAQEMLKPTSMGLTVSPFVNPITGQPKEKLFSQNRPELAGPLSAPFAANVLGRQPSNVTAPSVTAPSFTLEGLSGPQMGPERLFSSPLSRLSGTGSFTSSPSTSGPTVSGGGPNLFERIKTWGQSALGAVKGLFS